MRTWSTRKIILFIAICILMNVGGKLLSVWLELPIWADSFGTALCAYVAGPVCGAIVGLAGNLAYSMVNSLSAVYSITSIALGIIVGMAAKRKWFDQFYGFMKAASLAVLTALVVSVPINFIFSKGYTGNKWGDGLIDYLLDKEWPIAISAIFGQLAIEFADKVLTIATVYVVILVRQISKKRAINKTFMQGNTASQVIILALTSLLILSAPFNSQAAELPESNDYNDYVQNIYSSNNGLPCGEANAIAQTNDGVLWIGTYAGLYRYNGKEFRWIDDYESVKNVNCLYVDEEGRMWIGTNDNGLSITIREEIVNVLDSTSGLPSNSVRSIIRGTDGFYYIGTTSSMQIIVMNNGLKAVNTLPEVNYTESITADENGHVAAVTNDGRLFLMKGGEVISKLELPDDSELFNCCAFAPDGTLMVGTSTDQIYCYDVSGEDFKQVKTVTCQEASNINSLSYLSDGTLFITSDTGISYLDA
ncbi:MAG: HD domain protein, partial [Lachnospiraceae bacterium]|nr:HD domain protein [Lachnospiraceae bacterium]